MCFSVKASHRFSDHLSLLITKGTIRRKSDIDTLLNFYFCVCPLSQVIDASKGWNSGCFGSISCPIIVFLFGIKQINFSSWDIFFFNPDLSYSQHTGVSYCALGF